MYENQLINIVVVPVMGEWYYLKDIKTRIQRKCPTKYGRREFRAR